MTDRKNRGRTAVTTFRLTPKMAEQKIRKIAAQSDNVILGRHAQERMEEREIFDSDVFRVLRTEHVDEDPDLTERGEWKCKMVKQAKGGRAIGIITMILHEGKLFVKTVEWEDLK